MPKEENIMEPFKDIIEQIGKPFEIQKRLDYSKQPSEPWDDVCCEACWMAENKRCVCSCGGVFHGMGKDNKHYTGDPYLPGDLAIEFWSQIKEKKCRWCGEELTGSIQYYEHSGGWRVEGFKRRQWLYVQCSKCHYNWALWKLGALRK